MSDFKFSPNLFLEVVELDKFKSFVDSEGFRKNILQNTISYGLIKKNNDLSFLNGRVERDLDTTIGQKTIKIRPLQAIDNKGMFLSSPQINSIPVPADGRWYWVKVFHRYNTTELGKVTLAINGDLTGVGTKFTETLRGMPNFPSRIRFTNSSHNTLEYDVLEVIDDEHVIVMHPAVNGAGIATFEIESDLNYSVVGTFTPGVAVPESDKYPFQYDSISYQLIQEDTLNQRPSFISGQEFYLARVKIEDGDVIIQDKRIECWESQGKFSSLEINRSPNPLIGVEYIKWQNILSPANVNQVFVAWGMRSQNWAVDSSKNIVTLFGSASGGAFKTVDDFTNGDFDGWRIYTENGRYSKVVTSIKQGQAINLTLDVLDVDDYSVDGGLTFNNQDSSSQWVIVVPDAEEIEIIFTPQLDQNNNTSVSYHFPINTLIARCDVEVFQNPTCLFNVTYRYKTDRVYSEAFVLPPDEVGYYTEISFNEKGDLKSTDDRVLYPYEGVESIGYIQLTLSPNAYSILIDLIYKGDRIGVQTLTTFNTISVYELKVKRDKRYQYITGDINLTDDVFISLSSEGAVEGNEFRIHFNCSNLSLNGKKINIIRDYVAGSPTIIKEITQGDVYQMMNQDGGIVFDCVYSDTGKWNVMYQNYDLGVPNEIKSIDGVIADLFNSSGLGKVKGLYGYALCNGLNNTPNLFERFILGAGTQDTEIIEVGDQGGDKNVILTEAQLPSHSHKLFKDDGEGAGDLQNPANHNRFPNVEDTGGTNSSNYNIKASNNETVQPTIGRTGNIGQNQPHNNMPPYYALIFAKKLF